MEDKSGKTPAKSAGVDLLDNPQLYDLLISKVDRQADAAIRSRNETLRNLLIGLAVVFTTIGAFTVEYFVDKTVSKAIEKSVTSAVHDAVGPAVGRALENIEFDMEVTDLNFQVLKLASSAGFTDEEAETIIQRVGSAARLVVSRESPEELSKLKFVVDTAVTSFASANRLDFGIRLLNIVTQIENYEAIASGLFLNTSSVVQTMVTISGIALLGDAGAPSSWTDPMGSQNKVYADYRKYAKRAQTAGFPELYLLFEVLFYYIQSNPEEIIDNLIDDMSYLNKSDSENFAQLMVALASNNTQSNPDAASTRAADRVKGFLCEYGDRSDLLRSVMARVILEGVELRC